MKPRTHIWFVLIFILVQGITFAVTYYVMGYRYGSAQEARFSVLSEAILSLLVLYYIRRYSSWPKAGYGEVRWLRSLWMAPLLLPLLAFAVYEVAAIASTGPSTLEIVGVGAVALMTLMVGFAEETTFRGILLRGEMEYRSVFLALLLSAIGFSLLHSVNIFAGLSAKEVLDQLRSTLLVGLCLAPLAVLAGNLLPLVVWHFLWDFSSLVLTQVQPLTFSPIAGSLRASIIPIQIVMGIIGWVAVFVLWRRGSLRKA